MKIRRLTMGALMLALAVVFPQAFHLTGIPQTGMVFLPMHIPVLLTGFLVGPLYGLVVGLLAPILSFLLTDMPTAARLPFMIGELGIYGLVSGLMYYTAGLHKKKSGIVLSLIVAMICGRLFYALMLYVAAGWFGIRCGGPLAAWNATVMGAYGILIQVVFVPAIVYKLAPLGQGGFIRGINQKSRENVGG